MVTVLPLSKIESYFSNNKLHCVTMKLNIIAVFIATTQAHSTMQVSCFRHHSSV